MRIKLTVNGSELTGTLDEGAAARDSAALLPLTVQLSDFHGRERVADLPRPLDLAGEPAGTTAQPGDIAHYAPWSNLALFYGNQPHAEASSSSDASTTLPYACSPNSRPRPPPSSSSPTELPHPWEDVETDARSSA